MNLNRRGFFGAFGTGTAKVVASIEALQEVRSLSSSVRSHGNRLVQDTITRKAQEAKRAAQYAEERAKSEIERQSKSSGFGKALESVGDGKVFFQLSYDKGKAERKFAVIQELIKIKKDIYSFDNVPVVMRSDIRVEDITLPDGGKWPDDRCVPVPTQKYEHVWGVELSGEQFRKLTSFSTDYPNIAAELQLSEFSNTPTIQAHR